MEKELKDILKGKVVIVGIGNILRGDDGIGPVLIEKIKDQTRAVCIDAGTAPESYAGKILKENPDTILIVDATHLGRKPGEFQILSKSELLKSGFTTHDMSPHLFIEYLEHHTKASIYMLGVQPENLSFGDEVSESVRRTLQSLMEKIVEVICA